MEMLNCIYNMDETGMPLDHKQLKRIALKESKKFMARPQETRCRSLLYHVPILLVQCYHLWLSSRESD